MKDTMNSIKKVTFSKQTRSFLQFNIFDLQMTTMLMALFPSLSLSLSFSLSLSLSFSLIMQSALTTSTTTATKRIAPARLPCTVYRSARTLPPVPMLRFAVFEMPELQFVKSVAFLTGAWCTGETHDRPWHGLVSCWTRKRAQNCWPRAISGGHRLDVGPRTYRKSWPQWSEMICARSFRGKAVRIARWPAQLAQSLTLSWWCTVRSATTMQTKICAPRIEAHNDAFQARWQRQRPQNRHRDEAVFEEYAFCK
jgi:hypothetical protein